MPKYTKNIDEKARTLTIERRFHAPKSVVWDYHTKRDLLEKWWGPENYPTTVTAFDFRPGGTWHYYMTAPDGQKHYGLAVYTAIDNGNSFDYEDWFSDEQATKNTDLPVSDVRLAFRADGADTVVAMTLKFKTLEDLKKLAEMGFEHGMASSQDNLDLVLAKKAA